MCLGAGVPLKQKIRKCGYTEAGLSEEEIDQLLVLDIKDAAYFTEGGAFNQHGGGFLFAQDPEIMGWLFGQ